MNKLSLSILPSTFSVCRMEANAPVPDWAMKGSFFAITRTPDELSLVCIEDQVPPGVKIERGWRGIKVEGPLDFALTGILANLTGVLAQAKISLFAISTYDTDYILVKEGTLEAAILALREAGYKIDPLSQKHETQ